MRNLVSLDEMMKKQTGKTAARGKYMDMVVRQARGQEAGRPVGQNFNVGKMVTPSPGAGAALGGAARAGVRPRPSRAGMADREVRGVMPGQAPMRPAATEKPVTAPSRAVDRVAAPGRTTGGANDLAMEAQDGGPVRPSLFAEEGVADDRSPDGNNYSLGGRSPFLLADAKVDKRPLGPNVPESNAGAIRSTKNVYSQRTPLKAREEVVPGRGVITVTAPKKRSGWLWAALTVGIIVAGGGIGLLAYMIFAK